MKRATSCVLGLLIALLTSGCAREHVYAGVVRTPTGRPVAACEVTAFGNHLGMLIPLSLPLNLGSATTDAQGRFSLTTQRRAYLLDISGAGWGSARVGPSQKDLQISATPPRLLRPALPAIR